MAYKICYLKGFNIQSCLYSYKNEPIIISKIMLKKLLNIKTKALIIFSKFSIVN